MMMTIYQSTIYVDENGYVLEIEDGTPHSGGHGSRSSSQGRPRSGRARSAGRKRGSKFPKGELDDRHLYAVSSYF